MRRIFCILTLFTAIMLAFGSCKDKTKKEITAPVSEELSDTSGLIVIGRDMITEIIVNPDTLGDPWEAEKVSGYNGNTMFADLLGKIYSNTITVYDCLDEKALKPDEVKMMEKEFSSDLSKIGKFQFVEDWYFNPANGAISKRVKSVSFGYEITRESGLPSGYKAFFMIRQ